MAEGFSAAGVPVFCADVKGDLAGLADAGRAEGFPRQARRGRSASPPNTSSRRFPVVFWDLFGKQGHPIRATISEMGPLLLVAPARPQRHPGGRPQHRLQARRRGGAAAPRPQGPAGAARLRRRARQRAHHALRQRLQGDDRHHPARAPRARAAGRATASSASRRSTSSDLMRTDHRRPRHRQRARRRAR